MTNQFVFNVASESWGAILCIVGLISVYLLKANHPVIRRYFTLLFICNFVLLLSDALGWYLDGRAGSDRTTVLVVNTILYIASFTMMVLFSNFVFELLELRTEKQFRLKYLIQILYGVMIVLCLSNLSYPVFFFVGSDSVYHRTSFFVFTQISGLVVDLILLGVLQQYRSQLRTIERRILYTYILLPGAAMIVQLFFYGLPLLNLSTTIILLLIFLVMSVESNQQIERQRTELAEQQMTLARQEAELSRQKAELAEQKALLADSRSAIMLSQIQPHFLYNSLNSIYYLCSKDPKLARTAIEEFSDYLRVNLESLKIKELIPFERELQHIEKYLWLEQLRFDDRLEVEYDIEEKDFMLPSLTIQPLVENAVKHGVCHRPEGGIVTIHSHEETDAWIIRIQDDGVGFDTTAAPGNDGREHVGIENVRRRLEIECKGTLVIESKPGDGTICTVRIPKEVRV